MLLSETDFRGEINIPNGHAKPTCEILCHIIGEYEPQFLDAALGVQLASDFSSAIALTTVPAPYSFLRDGGTYTDLQGITLRWVGIKYAAARYVYWYYLRDLNETTTGSGVVQSTNENSIVVGTVEKQVHAWNQMCRSLEGLWYMLQNYNTAGTLLFTFDVQAPRYRLFQRQTVFGF